MPDAFPGGQTEASDFLDVLIDAAYVRRITQTGDEGYPRSLVGIDGESWSHEVVSTAVKLRGYHWERIRVAGSSAADLKTLLASTGPRARFFVDGILNKHWRRGKHRMCTDPTDPTDPAQERARWRHAVPVVDGVVREQLGMNVKVEWLWLDAATNQPDPGRGYLREVLRVYRVVRCRAPDDDAPAGGRHSRCRGECLR